MVASAEVAIAAWDAGDIEGFLACFTDDARFFVPGSTRLSGDHTRATVGPVLAVALEPGRVKQGVIERYASPNGTVVLVDHEVGGHHYHAMHLFELADPAADRFACWWLFTHEHDAFEAAWA
jgi:ketosteroid isomerase-like protein